MTFEITWNGETIADPGRYAGIPLETYHNALDLFDAPSISKSALKWLLPAHGGSPKAFWGRWLHNPDRIEPKRSDALDFGKAAHALLLGDEVFEDWFAVRPEHWADYKSGAARAWRDGIYSEGKTPITPDDMGLVDRMRADAATYPLVQQGLLNGAVERTLAWRDPATGIWLKVRPDVIPAADGVYADLKTAGSLAEDFLERQCFDACYYLQGAMIRMVCRELGLPFETFVLVYVLKDEVPDTAHVELSEFELDRGEREIRWALQTIRACLDAGGWPGARPFSGGERQLQLKPWAKEKIDDFLDREERAAA